MICAERAYYHWSVRRQLSIDRRARRADGKTGASLEGQQANETDEPYQEYELTLRRAATSVAGDAGVSCRCAQGGEVIDGAHNVAPCTPSCAEGAMKRAS